MEQQRSFHNQSSFPLNFQRDLFETEELGTLAILLSPKHKVFAPEIRRGEVRQNNLIRTTRRKRDHRVCAVLNNLQIRQ